MPKTVKEVIEQLKKMPQDGYISIGEEVLHGGLGSEYTSYICEGEIKNRGPVPKEEFIDFVEDSQFGKEYDETRPWIEIT